MKMNIKFASSAMLKNNNQNHMLIELEPPVPKTKAEKPNAWVFVVDKSSSMNTPINYNCFKSNYNISHFNDIFKFEHIIKIFTINIGK